MRPRTTARSSRHYNPGSDYDNIRCLLHLLFWYVANLNLTFILLVIFFSVRWLETQSSWECSNFNFGTMERNKFPTEVGAHIRKLWRFQFISTSINWSKGEKITFYAINLVSTTCKIKKTMKKNCFFCIKFQHVSNHVIKLIYRNNFIQMLCIFSKFTRLLVDIHTI